MSFWKGRLYLWPFCLHIAPFFVMEKGGAFSVSLTKDAVTQRNSNCYPWQNCIFLKGLGAFNVACLFTATTNSFFPSFHMMQKQQPGTSTLTHQFLHSRPRLSFSFNHAYGFLILYQFVRSCCHFSTKDACCPCTTYFRYVVKYESSPVDS